MMTCVFPQRRNVEHQPSADNGFRFAAGGFERRGAF